MIMRRRLLVTLALALVLLSVVYVSAKNLDANEKETLIRSLQDKSGYGRPLELNDDLYAKLTSKPRNFTLIILLTAEGQKFRCTRCWEFAKEFELVAYAAARPRDGVSLVVAKADFEQNQETFRKLGLSSVPYVQFFPPALAGDTVNPEMYDLNRKGAQAEDLAHYLDARAKITLRIKRPFNWTRLLSAVTILLLVASLAKLFYRHFVSALTSKKIWISSCIVGCLLFISGQMFVQIRGAPYAGQNGKGMEIFAGGFSNQYGIEVQIMTFLYGICSLCIVFLCFGPKRSSSSRIASLQIYATIALFLYCYSFILKVYREKAHYYPFKLFL